VTVDGEVRQEGRYLGRTHLQRMTLVVKQDESPNPPDVGVLRAQRQMADAAAIPDAIEKLRLAGLSSWRLLNGLHDCRLLRRT
jgi:hypothetical protein